MTQQVLNFKKVELTGTSKAEAFEKAPFYIQGDATQAFKLWKGKQTEAITDRSMRDFMIDYLQKKSKNAPGIGFAITVESPVADTRERPWTIEDVKNEGKRTYKKVIQLLDAETGKVLGEVADHEDKEGKPVRATKADAKELAKKLIKDGFHGTIRGVSTKQVVSGEATLFTCKYTPSKSAKAGNWIVFGCIPMD